LNTFLTLFPDVDSSRSRIRNLLAIFLSSVITIFFLMLIKDFIHYSLIVFVLFYFFFKFFPTKHRGFAHKFWFSVFFSLFIVILVWLMFKFSFLYFAIYFLFLFSGYASHLFLDFLSEL
jgi:membrane-bound metal-dependent hydrolase YbcI (DUF457 family)